MRKFFLIPAILTLLSGMVFAQTAAEYFDRANEAFKNKDYKSNVTLLEKSIEAGGDHPTILYFLARGYALTGATSKAIETLNRIADLGISYQPEKDSNFQAIHKMPEFTKAVARFEENLKRVNAAKPSITISVESFIPEGITFDKTDGSFYFGNITSGKIIRYKDGKFEDFSRPGDGLWSVLGMTIHQPTRTLWAASSALAGDAKGSSGIFQYDLRNRKLLNKYLVPSGNHVLGEVVVSTKGEVFTTDSLSPAIYILKNTKLEMFLGPDPFRSPQGACFSQDENILFVADYSRGIYGVDVKTKKHWKLSRNDGVTTLAGIDGLYCHKSGLIAIQNGVQPNRILRIHVSKDSTKVERTKILESNHDLFPEPTLGVIVDDEFYFVGNSLIGPYLENPKIELKPAVILKLSL